MFTGHRFRLPILQELELDVRHLKDQQTALLQRAATEHKTQQQQLPAVASSVRISACRLGEPSDARGWGTMWQQTHADGQVESMEEVPGAAAAAAASLPEAAPAAPLACPATSTACTTAMLAAAEHGGALQAPEEDGVEVTALQRRLVEVQSERDAERALRGRADERLKAERQGWLVLQSELKDQVASAQLEGSRAVVMARQLECQLERLRRQQQVKSRDSQGLASGLGMPATGVVGSPATVPPVHIHGNARSTTW